MIYNKLICDQIPDNKALDGLAGGIALAWELYGKERFALFP